jgi:hypothetical protein
MCRVLRMVAAVVVLGSACLVAAEPVPEEPATPPAREPVKPSVVLPEVTEGGGPLRIVTTAGFRIELDLSTQVLRLDVPEEHSWREEGEIRENDTVEVTASGAALRQGRETVARLTKGQRLPVVRIREDWIGTSVAVGGVRKGGWVRKGEVKFVGEDAPISPTLAGLARGEFVPAALLAQKAKQFDDGLYAAVDLAAQEGPGNFAGKAFLLRELARQIAEEDPGRIDQPRQVILAAAQLGGLAEDLSPAATKTTRRILAAFEAEPLRSKPIGFYTWSGELTTIFRQDRMLQTELTAKDGTEVLVRALHADPQLRAVYEGYLALVTKLTNPLSKPDLRPELAELDDGALGAPEQKVHFFPPSKSHESDLVMRLYGDRPIPEDFSLVDEVIARVRSGELDLTPRPHSGWYDYQTWSIEPLITPEKTPEAARLELADGYRKHLEELFKGVYALTRETHIKQTEIPYPAAEAPEQDPRPIVYIAPELTVEPLATYYLRRAASYQFVRAALEETFGSDALATMRRQTATGPVEPDLGSELADMEGLFQGAYRAAALQAGLVREAAASERAAAEASEDPAGDGPDPFLYWAANAELDPDVSQDARMMVPVFFDQQRKKTKVWVFLGWSSRGMGVSWPKTPAAKVLADSGEPVAEGEGPELIFHGSGYPLVSPITAELYVDRILDREEFRRHCDQYRTRSAILENLQ